MWDLPYFNLGNNLYMHTIGGASIKQETTATPETLAVLISKGALSQSPCTRHHLATIVRVPVHLIQTCSAVSFPVYPMPCCPKGELCPYQEEITGLPCSLLLWKMHTAHSRTGLSVPEDACWAVRAWKHLCRGVLERQWNSTTKH